MKRIRNMTILNSVDYRFKDIKPIDEIAVNIVEQGDLVDFINVTTEDDISLAEENISTETEETDETTTIDSSSVVDDESTKVYLIEPSVIMDSLTDLSNYHTRYYNIFPTNVNHKMCYGYIKNDDISLNKDLTLSFNMDVGCTGYLYDFIGIDVHPAGSPGSHTYDNKDMVVNYLNAIKQCEYSDCDFVDGEMENNVHYGDTFESYVTIRNFPQLFVMFSDRDLSKLTKAQLRSYSQGILGDDVVVKNFKPFFNKSKNTFYDEGISYLYKIVGTNTKFDNIKCYTLGSLLYDGSTNKDNLSDVETFKYLDDWSRTGMMYVILKNDDYNIPFKLALVQKKTKILEDETQIAYPDIIKEYPMYRVTSRNQDLNVVYCMCERNVQAQHFDPSETIPYITYNYNIDKNTEFVNCSCSVDIKDMIFSVVNPEDPDKPEEELKRLRYTYFLISPVGGTYGINENAVLTHHVYKHKTTGDIFEIETPEDYAQFNEHRDEYKIFKESTLAFNVLNRYGNTQTSDYDPHNEYFNTNRKFQWNESPTEGEFFGYINDAVGEIEQIDANDGFNRRPSMFIKNLNVTTSDIQKRTFNEAYRSNKKFHYKKDGTARKSPLNTIRKYISQNRPDLIFCIGDGNKHGLFANSNQYVSRRTHKRRLISNRDVDLLRASYPPISLIHYDRTDIQQTDLPIDKYSSYMKKWKKAHPNDPFTNYDIVDRYGFKHLKYFTSYIFLNVEMFENILGKYSHGTLTYNETIGQFNQKLNYSIYNGVLNGTDAGKSAKVQIKTVRQPLLILLWQNSLYFALDNILRGIVCGNVYLTTSQVFSHIGIKLSEKEMQQANQALCNVIAATLAINDDLINNEELRQQTAESMTYKYGLGGLPALCGDGGMKIDVETRTDLSDLQQLVVQHNMKQIYLIKGYGKVSMKLKDADRQDIGDGKYKVTNPNVAAFNKVVVIKNQDEGIYTTPVGNPKYTFIKYNNFYKDSKTKLLKKNTKRKYKFTPSVDDAWIVNLFDHTYVDEEMLFIKIETMYDNYFKPKKDDPVTPPAPTGNIKLLLHYGGAKDLNKKSFTTKDGCAAGKHVTDYFKEPIMFKPMYTLVGWTSKNYILDPSIEIKKTDIQQFGKLLIEENQTPGSLSILQGQHICAYFAVWRYIDSSSYLNDNSGIYPSISL